MRGRGLSARGVWHIHRGGATSWLSSILLLLVACGALLAGPTLSSKPDRLREHQEKIMFRKRDPQMSLFESIHLVPEEKRERMTKTWAEQFRQKALPLIQEDRFECMYCKDNGAPNKPVQIVLGTLILKDMFDLTDMEALEQLEFNLLWQYALRLTPDEAHICQKTLHNFRVGLLEHDLGKAAFEEITDRIIETCGISTSRQRLDSTHIVSNIAILTRLGLFCETIRVFLSGLSKKHPRLFTKVPEEIRKRYLRDDGDATRYSDAKRSESRRRLRVCALDLYWLVERFRGSVAAKLAEYEQIERLLKEQCDVAEKDSDSPDGGGVHDGEERVPVSPKDPKSIESDSLQTPHDPDVTYSGHKGKGYEAQFAETCDEENDFQVLTEAEVTPSSGSDANATIPVLESLEERGLRPDEMSADTAYGSAKNALEAERMGTELISPVGGSGGTDSKASDETEEGDDGQDAAQAQDPPVDAPELTPADFQIDPTLSTLAVCPAGNQSHVDMENPDNPNKVDIVFERGTCDECPLRGRCPVVESAHGPWNVLTVDLEKRNLERRRRAERSGQFQDRYAIRAGIESANSEFKRAHGGGRLRVRGGKRVKLAVYLKAAALNVKRMLQAGVRKAAEVARTEGEAVLPASA